ncbi:hypothetical protein DPSP01_004313 [Paraphaeosphaeria sporulosa]
MEPIESALKHVIDLRNLPFRPLSDDVLEMATSCLIRLDRDQEAYNYLTHWTSRYKDHDRFEAPDIFEGMAPSAAFLASVFLVKLRLFTAMDSARQCYIKGGNCSDPRIMTTLEKCGLKDVMKEGPKLGEHLSAIIFTLQDDMKELYLQVEQIQPDFWSRLPSVHENREPCHDNSCMEIQQVLHCYTFTVLSPRLGAVSNSSSPFQPTRCSLVPRKRWMEQKFPSKILKLVSRVVIYLTSSAQILPGRQLEKRR